MSYTVTLRETDKKKVYVDPGIREGIYLYPGEIKKLKLLEGSMLEEDEFERIRLQYALPRAKHRAIAILAKRDKTEKELRDKLQKACKGVPPLFVVEFKGVYSFLALIY